MSGQSVKKEPVLGAGGGQGARGVWRQGVCPMEEGLSVDRQERMKAEVSGCQDRV